MNDSNNKKDLEMYEGPMVKIEFLKEYEMLDENADKTGEIMKVGEVIEVPEPVVKGLVDDGIAKVVEEKPKDSTKKGAANAKKDEEKDETIGKSKVVSVNVIDSRGLTVRTYSLEKHGKDFMKLAKEFVDRRTYRLK